ncbi:MAG: carbohydrate-binding family 9-like protein [Cyclobacteriaceae bacterium]
MKVIPHLILLMALSYMLVLSSCTNDKETNTDQPDDLFTGLDHLFTPPKNYVVYKTSKPIVVDGDINDEDWQKARWSDEFEDIEGDLKPSPYLRTRMKMLWDDEYFYFAAELIEPHVWATLTEHDEVIFIDNDFEIFIDADNDRSRNYKFPDHDTHRYYEFEMNAFNTTWDLFLDKPYRNGGLPMTNWEIKGLKTGVNVIGTINNPGDTDEAWTVEVAIPFSAICFGRKRENPPSDGDQYRVNFSRVQYDIDIIDGKYIKQKDSLGKDLPCYNWVWSPQGVINMHYPERWGYAQFSEAPVGTKEVPFVSYYSELQKKYLWLIYYRQQEIRRKGSRYSSSLKDLGFSGERIVIDGKTNNLTLEAISNQFEATIQSEDDQTIWSINQEGLVQQSAQP